LSVDGHPFPIVAVTEQKFFGMEVGRHFDVALPICTQPLLNPENNALTTASWWWLGAVGRLRPGVSLEQATAELQSVSPGIFESTLPGNYNAGSAGDYKAFRLAARPAADGTSSLRTQYGDSLTMLLWIAGLVLLIACGNLANLMLARASTRRREMAVRLAIGASRRRLVRQLMAESLLVAAAGAVLGLWIAGLLGGALVSFIETPGSPLFLDIAPGWRMTAFATGLGILTCVAFGLVPALRATRTQPGAALGSRGETDPSGRFNLRRVLVVGQLAVSLVLLVGAMLFVLTFYNVATIDPGIETAGVIVAEYDYRRAGVADEAHGVYQREFVERLAALPGVGQTSRVSIVPLSGSSWNQSLFVDGQLQTGYPLINRVDGNYFALVGSPIVAGRTFDVRDVPGASNAAIVTEKFVEKYMPGRNPIGRSFNFDAAPNEIPTVYTVVGVARNARYSDVHDDVEPMVYLAIEQETNYGPSISVLVRPDVAAKSVTPALIAAARERPGVLAQVSTLGDAVKQTLVRERLMAALAGFFGILAAALAAIGLYGVMSYTVSRRRQEIGVRMALGAGRGRILAMVLREAAVMVAAGLAVGGVLAAFGARYAQSLLFGLTATDARVIGGAAALLAIIAALASLWPAQRAARLQPTVALRDS
jgi:predicted permease